jgi:uncharacterized membrane protein
MNLSKSRVLPFLALGLVVLPVAALAQDASPAPVADHAVNVVSLLSRWLHIFGAIFLMGGAFYMRAILIPSAAEALDDATHQKLRASLMGRWRKWIMVLSLVLIATGLYNFLAVTRFAHPGQPTYHMLFGIKFLLAIAVFGLASMLAGRKSISLKLQQNAKLWLGITLAMGAAIVMIAGYMKMM